jgi:hypothetical protein
MPAALIDAKMKPSGDISRFRDAAKRTREETLSAIPQIRDNLYTPELTQVAQEQITQFYQARRSFNKRKFYDVGDVSIQYLKAGFAPLQETSNLEETLESLSNDFGKENLRHAQFQNKEKTTIYLRYINL